MKKIFSVLSFVLPVLALKAQVKPAEVKEPQVKVDPKDVKAADPKLEPEKENLKMVKDAVDQKQFKDTKMHKVALKNPKDN